MKNVTPVCHSYTSAVARHDARNRFRSAPLEKLAEQIDATSVDAFMRTCRVKCARLNVINRRHYVRKRRGELGVHARCADVVADVTTIIINSTHVFFETYRRAGVGSEGNGGSQVEAGRGRWTRTGVGYSRISHPASRSRRGTGRRRRRVRREAKRVVGACSGKRRRVHGACVLDSGERALHPKSRIPVASAPPVQVIRRTRRMSRTTTVADLVHPRRLRGAHLPPTLASRDTFAPQEPTSSARSTRSRHRPVFRRTFPGSFGSSLRRAPRCFDHAGSLARIKRRSGT